MRHRPRPTVSYAASSPRQRTHDIELIHGVVARVESTQRARDVDGFTRLLTPEAVWVTAFGRRLNDWPKIREFTASVLTPAIGDEHAFYDVEHVTFLSDTIAVVNVRQRPVDAAGAPLAGRAEGRPLYVMSKHGDGWMIAAGQNTPRQEAAIAAQAQALPDRQ